MVVQASTAAWARLAEASGGRGAGVPGTVSSGHLLLAALELGQMDVWPLLGRVCDLDALQVRLEVLSVFHDEEPQPIPHGFAPAKDAIARFRSLVDRARSETASGSLDNEIDRVNNLVKDIVRSMASASADVDGLHERAAYQWFATRLHAELDQLEAHIESHHR